MHQLLIAGKQVPHFFLWQNWKQNTLSTMLLLATYGQSELVQWNDMLAVLNHNERALLNSLRIDKTLLPMSSSSFKKNHHIKSKINVNTITNGSYETNIMIDQLVNSIIEKWRVHGYKIDELCTELPILKIKNKHLKDADMVLNIVLETMPNAITDLAKSLKLNETPIVFFDDQMTSYDYLFHIDNALKDNNNTNLTTLDYFRHFYQKSNDILDFNYLWAKWISHSYNECNSNFRFEQAIGLFHLLKNRPDIQRVWTIMQSCNNIFSKKDLVEIGLIMAHSTIHTPTELFQQSKPFSFHLLHNDLEDKCIYNEINQIFNKNTIAYWDKEKEYCFTPMPKYNAITHDTKIKIGVPESSLQSCNPLYLDWIKSLNGKTRSKIHHHFDLIGMREGITFATQKPTLGIPYCYKSNDSEHSPLLTVADMDIQKRSSRIETNNNTKVIDYHKQENLCLYIESIWNSGDQKFYNAFPKDDVQPKLKSHLGNIDSEWLPLTLNAEAIELRSQLEDSFSIWFNDRHIATPMVSKETNIDVQAFVDKYFKRNTTVFNYDRLLSIIAIMQIVLPELPLNVHNLKQVNEALATWSDIEQIHLTATILKMLSINDECEDKESSTFVFKKEIEKLAKSINWKNLSFDMTSKPIFVKSIRKGNVEPFVVVDKNIELNQIKQIINGNLYKKIDTNSVIQWKELFENLLSLEEEQGYHEYQYAISEYKDIKNEMRFCIHNGKVVSGFPCQRKASYPQTYLFGRIAPLLTENHNSNTTTENRELVSKMTWFARNVAKEHYRLHQNLKYLYEGDIAPQSFLFMDIGTVWNETTQEEELIVIEIHHYNTTPVMRSSWYGNNQARLYSSVYGKPFSMNEHWNYLFGEHIAPNTKSNSQATINQPKSYISKYISHLKKQGVPIKPFITLEQAQQLHKQGIVLNNIADVIEYHIQWDKLENKFLTNANVDIPALLANNQSYTIKEAMPFFENDNDNNLLHKPLLLDILLARHEHLCQLACCNENDKHVLQKILKLECVRLLQVNWCYIKSNRNLNKKDASQIDVSKNENILYLLKMARLTKQLSPELQNYITLKYGIVKLDCIHYTKMNKKNYHINMDWNRLFSPQFVTFEQKKINFESSIPTFRSK